MVREGVTGRRRTNGEVREMEVTEPTDTSVTMSYLVV